MNKSTWYFPEIRERAVRMVFEHEREHSSQRATICSIATKIVQRSLEHVARTLAPAGILCRCEFSEVAPTSERLRQPQIRLDENNHRTFACSATTV